MEEKNGDNKVKNDDNIGHYVIASSRPPKCRPTGTAHACAKKIEIFTLDFSPSSVQRKLSLADSLPYSKSSSHPTRPQPVRNSNYQAQSSSSFSFTEQTELALFPIYPATHPSSHPPPGYFSAADNLISNKYS